MPRRCPVLDGRPRPASVLNAVKVMYAGAVVCMIQAVGCVVTAGAEKTAVGQKYPYLHAHGVTTVTHIAVIAGVVATLIGAALFIWIARSCEGGQSWAWGTGTVPSAVAVLHGRHCHHERPRRRPGRDQSDRADQVLRSGPCGSRHRSDDRSRRDGGSSRAEWCGEDDDVRHDARPDPPGSGNSGGLRRAAAGGRACGPDRGHAPEPGRRPTCSRCARR